MGILTKIGCFLVGWKADILKECGEASYRTLKKYLSAIIILSVIWGTIGFCFAERYVGIDNLYGKLLVSCTFIVIIVCIERFIILTVGKLGWMAWIRGFLALLMAVLGSTIFDQIIFKNDVEVKMKEIRTEQINKEIPKRMEYLDSEMQRVTMLIDSLGRENIRIYGELSKNPVITTTDVSTTTRRMGVDADGNPIEEKVTSLNRRSVENPLNAQAKANENAVKMYEEQKVSYQQEKMRVADEVRKSYEEADVGFLEELEALFSVLRGSWIALGFYAFLFLFLMLLELLVVTSKGGDGDCDYDLIVEHQLNIKRNTLENTERRLLNTTNPT